MYRYIQKLASLLSEEDKKLLQAIYEPQIVAVPPCDAARHLCVTPEGEIRIYGWINKKEPNDHGTDVYIASRDGGLSWKTHLANPRAIGSAAYNPETGRYISTAPNEWLEEAQLVRESGTFALLSDRGYDDTDFRVIKLSDDLIHVLRNPTYLAAYHRWFIVGERREENHEKFVHVFTSDDDGETWTHQKLPHAPVFEIKPPHKSTRWQEYSCEPTIADMGNGEILMLVRTCQDFHYQHRSFDGGLTWSDPEPSPFHGTITMPVLKNLSDGRVVLFWCNNQPMPELDKNAVFPPLDSDETHGIWEDVFTNRDVNHLAITSDGGKSWQGFRELFRNTIRNNADFRSIGGVDSRDKSVHQAEFLELPYHKLLVSFGQNTASRKVVILDVDWLYERERKEDFRLGLQGISTQMYVKSNLGGYRGWSGHCAYNRTHGALLVPAPEGNFREVLQLCRTEDPRLAYQKQGAVWNFPAAKEGKVQVVLRVMGSGVALSLCDHWYNPADDTVLSESFFTVTTEELELTPDTWHTVALDFDTEAHCVTLSVNGESRGIFTANTAAPMGLCYLHLQTTAQAQDFAGTYIKSMEMKGN